MITTFFKSFTVDSQGYDLLETGNETPSKSVQWLRKKTAQCEALAKEYFATKERRKYYCFSCYQEGEDRDITFYAPLTNGEVDRISKLAVQVFNANVREKVINYDETDLAFSFDEMCKKLEDEKGLFSLKGKDRELDRLMFYPCYSLDYPIELRGIDLEQASGYYGVIYQEYGREPLERTVRLTDEEYLYLLTQRLLHEFFNFNRLLLYRPELAQNISSQLDGCCNRGVFESCNSYLIVLDEVNADAARIKERHCDLICDKCE